MVKDERMKHGIGEAMGYDLDRISTPCHVNLQIWTWSDEEHSASQFGNAL